MAGTKSTVEINGFVVRELRIRDGRSVQALAKEITVTRAYIAKIELGHSTRVSPQVFNALLAAFSIEDRRVLLANPHGTAAVEESVA
jgi:transcriptional regulator with XRE-family HTH domain